MDRLTHVDGIGRLIARLRADAAAARARAEEAVRESQRLQAESRQLIQELNGDRGAGGVADPLVAA
jgi:hypothetical protein